VNKKQLILAWVIVSLISAINTISFAEGLEEHNNSARVINANVGKEFIITLESNRTTGFEWQLSKPLDKNIIQLLNSEYKVGETKLIGSGGKEIWVFKAIGAGKTTISFKYVRPWEKDNPPIKEEFFTIIIQEN
jgi:inhibitor of cysteine peptidase